MRNFPWHNISNADFVLAAEILGYDRVMNGKPDLVIAPDGVPYLYRWHVIPQSKLANVYFHIQVASDPERPLHDHPWDNTSVILAGGYDELRAFPAAANKVKHDDVHYPHLLPSVTRRLRKGNIVHRKATEAHRLILPEEFLYTMTLFSTGPKVRDWGFWYPEGWRSASDVTRLVDGVSQHIKGESNG